MGEYIHIDQNGKETPLSKLSDNHLKNILNYIERSARQGVEVQHGCRGFGSFSEVFYDEEILSYEEGLKTMNHSLYLGEYNRRRLSPKDDFNEHLKNEVSND